MASQNMCAISKIGAYFRAGVMPGNESFCAFEPGNLNVSVTGNLEETIAHYGLARLVH
jgi:hypothetical protein